MTIAQQISKNPEKASNTFESHLSLSLAPFLYFSSTKKPPAEFLTTNRELASKRPSQSCTCTRYIVHTVHKIGLILHPIDHMPKMQFSMARKFMLHPLRGYNVKSTEKPHKHPSQSDAHVT
jgi:hypothetical protein